MLDSSEYVVTFDNKELYISIENSNYDLSAAKVDVIMDVSGIKTYGTYLYKANSQDIVSLKDVISKELTGSTEDTNFDLRLIKKYCRSMDNK